MLGCDHVLGYKATGCQLVVTGQGHHGGVVDVMTLCAVDTVDVGGITAQRMGDCCALRGARDVAASVGGIANAVVVLCSARL